MSGRSRRPVESHTWRKAAASSRTPKRAGCGARGARALRYGLDPGATPDVVITSAAPGEGGFPAEPHYLSRSMPWPSFRHMPDYELWDIVAYLQHGITALPNAVPANPTTHPPREFRQTIIGPPQLPAFPIGNEVF